MLLGAAQAAAPSPDLLAVHATVTTLDNGLTVVLEEQHRTDMVALHLRYGVGSRDQAAGQGGCAHLFEHLMFEGSAHVPNKKFDDWLTAAGADNNAFTTENETAYHMTYPSGAMDLALFLESDRMGFLLAGLTPTSLKNQQDVVLRERAQDYAAAHGRDWDALTTLMYPAGHPYHSPVIGTEGDIRAFTLDSTTGFWKEHYRPRNAVLALVGNFKTDDAIAAIKKWWSDVPDNGPAVPRGGVPVLAPRRADGFLEDQVDDWTVYLAWPGVPRFSPDEPALDLLAKVLSGGRGTRLDDALYYKSGLTTSIYADFEPGDLGGPFALAATSPKSQLTKIAGVMEKIVGGVQSHPPTADELGRALESEKSRFLDEVEEPEGRANALADCQAYFGHPDCLQEWWSKYEAVKPEDLVRVAKTYLGDDRRISLSVVPTGKGGQLPGSNKVELP